jgi:ABC-type uncharacterized transport system involved in gliding motility auxiliary subunit
MIGRAPLFGLLGLVCLLFGLGGAFMAGGTLESFGALALVVMTNILLGLFFLGLFLTTGWEALRGLLGQRQARLGSGVVISTVMVVIILGAAAYLSNTHSYRLDLTEAGVFGLAPQSRQVLESLDDRLEIHAFVEGGISPQLKALLESYARESPRVSYQLVDPDASPDLVGKFGIATLNSVRIGYGNESTVVTTPTEDAITNGIIKVTQTSSKTVCFVAGHGEPAVDDEENPRGYAVARKALENENYEVKTIIVASEGAIDESCTLVAITSPQRPFLPGEVNIIEEYLKQGGHLLVLLPPQAGDPDLVTMLARWGALVGDDVVIDQQMRLFQGPTVGIEPIAAEYGQHPITERFRAESITVYNLARSVEPNTEGTTGLTAVSLVKTGPRSWAESDVTTLFEENRVTLDGTDRQGPISLAVAATANLKEMGTTTEGEARLVVFGNGRFADNQYLANPSFFNRDLFLNSVGWLVGQEELVSVRSRSVRASRIQLTPEQNVMIFVTSVLLMPQLLLLAGIVVWWRRRSR